LGQGGCEKVLAGDAPEDLAAGPRRDPGGEQRRGGPVDGAVAAPDHLVQRAERQAPIWEAMVQDLQAKRQKTLRRTAAGLDLCDRGAQSVEGARGLRDEHGLQNRIAVVVFPIRSA
jgi:hypothetical protein